MNFALNASEDCVVYTLDLPPDDRSAAIEATNSADAGIIRSSQTGIDYQGKDVAGKIKQLYGDSMSFDFSPYFGKMDIVFVDGAHHYAAVESDTKNALRMAKPGGVVIWHDFANYGDYNDVTRAVLANVPPGEVIQIEDTQFAIYRRLSTK